MVTPYTTNFVTVYFTDFVDKHGNAVLPEVTVEFFYDGEKVEPKIVEVLPYDTGSVSCGFSTAGLSPGIYEIVGTGIWGDQTLVSKGRIELREVDAEDYYVTKIRSRLFDLDAARYSLNLNQEQQVWPLTLVYGVLADTLNDMNNHKAQNDRGYTYDTCPWTDMLITGAIARALESRAVFEVRENFQYGATVAVAFTRDYTGLAAQYRGIYETQKDRQITGRRPSPMALKSSIIFSEVMRMTLSVLPGGVSFWRFG